MQGGALHSNMVEQLSALNSLQLERVRSEPLTCAVAVRVHECFARRLGGAVDDTDDNTLGTLPATPEGCSQALVPALLLQALSRTFDRYAGYAASCSLHIRFQMRPIMEWASEACITAWITPWAALRFRRLNTDTTSCNRTAK